MNDDTKVINDTEELKRLSDIYTSPCVKCRPLDGCLIPAQCYKYKTWLKLCKVGLKGFTSRDSGKE